MPELPEVEVIRQGLLPHLEGQPIVSISAGSKSLRLPIPIRDLQKWINNQTITCICRRSKYLIFFTDPAAMIIHLGMSGRLGIFAAGSPPMLHDHLVFRLQNGTEMRYNDIRRFGFIKVVTPEDIEKKDPFAHLGPEPLSIASSVEVKNMIMQRWQTSFAESHRAFSPAYLKKSAGKRLQPIKNFLMDSQVIAGIGNIYANEILYSSGMLPATPIGSVSLPGWEKIYSAIPMVLSKAISSGGTTIRDFISSSGQPGYFQLELNVYGREGQPCRACSTPIKKTIIAGRATYFCPRCQT